MRKTMRWAWALGLCVASSQLWAQSNMPWDEYERRIRSAETLTVAGPDIFGDAVNFYTGGLSFTATDIDIPGNSGLPVRLTRTMAVSNRKGYSSNDLPMADWDLDLPRIDGLPAKCDTTDAMAARPPIVNVGGMSFFPSEYWNGTRLMIPGQSGGDMLLINAAMPRPSSGGPYYWIAGQTVLSCLPSGYLAVTPDGTKYWLDWRASFQEPALNKKEQDIDATMARSRAALYASRVEDRFGNSVVYNYSNGPTGPVRLNSIVASDNRTISLTYNASGFIATASDGTRTWNYEYNTANPKVTLSAVNLPDDNPTGVRRRWTFDFYPFTSTVLRYYHGEPGEIWRDCFNPGDVVETSYVGTVTHPSGAVGQFTVFPTRFGQTNVPQVCTGYRPAGHTNFVQYSYYPVQWDSFALVKKRVTGPGVPDAEWNYSYYSDAGWASGQLDCRSDTCYVQPACSDAAGGTAEAAITGPDGFVRYTYGNRYRCNEGKLFKVERGPSAASIMRTETMTYALAETGQPFIAPIGTSPQPRSVAYKSEYPHPQTSTAVSLDGATFTSEVPATCAGGKRCFDNLGRSLRTAASSSLGFSRVTATDYYDDNTKWVMGQVKRQYDPATNVVSSQVDYDPVTALPVRKYSFGKLEQSFTYNGDGTLATASDGRNNATVLSNWKRGVPQGVRYADNSTESIVVNDLGWVMSATNEAGSTTIYEYDLMGRINKVVAPLEGGAKVWNDKVITTEPVPAAEYGIPAGHWRQIVIQGNQKKIVYFDAFFRPVVEQEEDFSNPTGTLRWVTRRFDAAGRPEFESYPRNPYVDGGVNAGTAVNGTRTYYDGLGRVNRVEQDSELGVLATTTEYLPGFKRQVTNPRGIVTVTQYEAYDSPDSAQPLQINTPDSGTTLISRDRYGKPTAITRWGPGL